MRSADAGQADAGQATVSGAPIDTAHLLTEPTARAARAVALTLLDGVDAEHVRLERTMRSKRARNADGEALHDFRVAVRRLRSWLRAYSREIRDSVGNRTLNLLGELARATTDSRDIEVHLAWIAAQSQSLEPAERSGARLLARHLTSEKVRADAELRSTLADEFATVSARLRKNLGRYAVAVWDQEPGDRWAITSAAKVREGLVHLRRKLAAIEHVDDDEQAHEARIAGKRLRYLLEPLDGTIAGIGESIEILKRLQDLLGSMHDAHVFTRVVRRLARTAPRAKRGSTGIAAQRGIRTLATRLKARRAESWTAFTDDWIEHDSPRLSDAVHGIVRDLQNRGGAGVEIERKYLLRKLPPEAKHAPFAEIAQGYLPGSTLIERVRRIESGDRVRYVRTVKAGSGLVRSELEEECSYGVYQALWPLTKGKRIRKRRYQLADAGHVWEIDEFLDQRLVLAEIELTSARDEVAIPDWLARCLVREVTGDPDYVNAVLAH